jgi:hypothetical protein
MCSALRLFLPNISAFLSIPAVQAVLVIDVILFELTDNFIPIVSVIGCGIPHGTSLTELSSNGKPVTDLCAPKLLPNNNLAHVRRISDQNDFLKEYKKYYSSSNGRISSNGQDVAVTISPVGSKIFMVS